MVTLLSKGKCCERKLLNSILLSKFLQLVLNHRNCIARHRHLRPQGTYFAGHIRLLRSCLGFFFFSFFFFKLHPYAVWFCFLFVFFWYLDFFFWFFFLFVWFYICHNTPFFIIYIYNLFVIIYVRLTQKLNKENGYNSLFLTSLSASGLKKYYKIIK